MLLRKINAGVSLLTTFFLLGHAIFLSIWMLSRCSIEKSNNFIPWILLGLMVIHALISIELGVSAHKDIEKKKCKTYPKQNIVTVLQRMSGVAMILLIMLHIMGSANGFQPQILHAVLHPLFFGLALSHAAVSTSKAFVTLGIGNAKLVKVIDIVMGLLCGVTIIASILGFCLCLFMGATK